MALCCCYVLLQCLSLQTKVSQVASHETVLSQAGSREALLSQAASHEAASTVLYTGSSSSTLQWVLCHHNAAVLIIGYGHVGITASC